MKTLSIQQPWASLITCGIKDTENRTWDTKHRGRILIHASSKKVPRSFDDNLPVQIYGEIENQRLFGNFPMEYSDLPVSAIVGYVDVVDCTEEMDDSIWSGGPVMWKLANAYYFDEPILNVKGKLNLFETEMDEDNLPPAHKAELRLPHLGGTTLHLPLSDEAFEYYSNCPPGEGKILLEYCNDPELYGIVDFEEGTLRDVKTLHIMAQDGREKTIAIKDCGFTVHVNDDLMPLMVPSLFHEDLVEWECIYFEW